MSNIYEYFNCKSKEELYEKVRNEDPSVQSLNDFISFVKGNDIFEKNKAITSPKIYLFFDFIVKEFPGWKDLKNINRKNIEDFLLYVRNVEMGGEVM